MSKDSEALLLKALQGYIAMLTSAIVIGGGIFAHYASGHLESIDKRVEAVTESAEIDRRQHAVQEVLNSEFKQQITELKQSIK